MSIVFFLDSALLAFVSVCVSWISHGLGIERVGQKTLKGASSRPEWASLCAPRQQGREAYKVEARQGWALPLPGFPRCTPPWTPAPQHWLVIRASWSVCLPLTLRLCAPLRGFLCILAPPLQQSSRSGVSTCQPGLCGVGAAAQPAGRVPVSWGGSTGAQGLAPGEAFPMGLHLPCVTWCLSLCSPAEKVLPGLHAFPQLWPAPREGSPVSPPLLKQQRGGEAPRTPPPGV